MWQVGNYLLLWNMHRWQGDILIYIAKSSSLHDTQNFSSYWCDNYLLLWNTSRWQSEATSLWYKPSREHRRVQFGTETAMLGSFFQSNLRLPRTVGQQRSKWKKIMRAQPGTFSILVPATRSNWTNICSDQKDRHNRGSNFSPLSHLLLKWTDEIGSKDGLIQIWLALYIWL